MISSLFNFDLEKISSFSAQEIEDRKKNLKLFLEAGLPSKKDENWKFTDLNFIIKKNFNKITNNLNFEAGKKINLIKIQVLGTPIK